MRGIDAGRQRVQFVFVGKVGAHGILPLLAEQSDRLWDAGMGFGIEWSYQLAGIGDQITDRHVLVDHAIDEAGVGAVFQQATHQVRQQVLMAANRRVHPARHVEVLLADHFGIQVGAHAVQALVLVGSAMRVVVDGGNRVRVVGGKLRIDELASDFEHLSSAGEVGNIGVRLAREHRVAGKPLFLGALDFGVPIGALDQAYAPAPLVLACGFGQPVDHERRALLVGLHGQAEAVPAGE